jgi:PAS domain S-box-containing protein
MPAQEFCEEDARLRVIASFGIEHLHGDEELSELVQFAAQLCETPIALISLIEEHRQKFLARFGLEATDTPRSDSFCAHAMLGKSAMIIRDAREDPTFRDNPLVTGEPHIRFYAGMPLISAEGAPIGALCVIDSQPRPLGLTKLQSDGMKVLARSVLMRLEGHRTKQAKAELVADNQVNFRKIIESLPDITWSANANGEITYINQRWTDYTGLPASDHDSDHIRAAYHPDEVEAWKRDWLEAILCDQQYQGEYRLRRKDGTYGWILARAMPLKNRRGQIVSWFGQLIDIDAQHQLADERKAISDEHRSTAQFLQTILDNVPTIAWSSQADGSQPIFSARFREVTGCEPPQSTQDWSRVIHPDDLDAALKEYEHAARGATMFEREVRLRQADGSYRWVLSRAIPSTNDPQTAHWFGTLTDVDDAYRRSQERELLAGELAHRLKNIFSVINGLVTLHTRGDENSKAVGKALTDNIQALSHAQDFALKIDDKIGKKLRALLELVLAPYAIPGTRAVTISGDEVDIGARSATPLALVTHELATNSAKYGALREAHGQVAIILSKTESDAIIEWAESDGPPVSEPTREGFGSRLIALTVNHQLGGSIEYDWRASGLIARITLPLARIEQ